MTAGMTPIPLRVRRAAMAVQQGRGLTHADAVTVARFVDQLATSPRPDDIAIAPHTALIAEKTIATGTITVAEARALIRWVLVQARKLHYAGLSVAALARRVRPGA